MTSKKQPYLNKPPPVEPGAVPPRYQPPPQVTGPSNLKQYPKQPSGILVNKDANKPSYPPPPLTPEAPKQFTQQEVGKYYPPPPAVINGEGVKQYSGPPQYPAPPAVIQPPSVQRRPGTAAVGLPQRLSDEELLRLGPVEMLKFVRKAEGESARVTSEQSQAARDAARRIQAMAAEIRALKEANQRLSDDNQELRDLCCFLDDDRQKGRKLAREWQRFGRYTASVMRQEVSAYQSKLRELDNKQQELIKDNLELKELCLYLDEERSQNVVCPTCGSGLRPGTRDDGDGSSSSTNADEPALPTQFSNHRRTDSRERLLEESIHRQRTVFSDQMMNYVRSLEQRVKKLEEEKLALQQKLRQRGDSVDVSDLPTSSSWESDAGSRPEAVVQALQVLEVREQLERSCDVPPLDMVTNDLDDGEKALVREMCNMSISGNKN